MSSYVAECLWPGVTQAQFEALDGRAALSGRRPPGAETRVNYRGSLLMPDDEVVFCFFEAPSERAVALAARLAEIPYTRILPFSGRGVIDMTSWQDQSPTERGAAWDSWPEGDDRP